MLRRAARVLWFLLGAWALAPHAARAQEVDRVAIDSAIGINQFFGGTPSDRPDIIVDVTAAVRLGRGWTGYVRPWFRQPSTGPNDIAKEIYQAALQYERAGRVSTRVDLGYILSPIGLGMLDMRADTNPLIMPHLSYLVPMPGFDAGVPSSLPIASSYPLGGQFTASASHWDARAAVVTAPPNRNYVLYAATPNPLNHPSLIVGGGVTPKTGLRVGVGYARGEYASADEVHSTTPGARDLEMFSVEGEFAFAYTKLSGEITHDRMSTAADDAHAMQWFLQGTQTVTPRWFAAARHEGANSPRPRPNAVVMTLRTNEAGVGFRLSQVLTLRTSVASRKTYFNAAADHQIGVSLVWAQRWR